MSIVPQQQKNFFKKEKKKASVHVPPLLPWGTGLRPRPASPPPHIYTLNYGAHIFVFSGIRESFYIMESKGQRLHERREQTC